MAFLLLFLGAATISASFFVTGPPSLALALIANTLLFGALVSALKRNGRF